MKKKNLMSQTNDSANHLTPVELVELVELSEKELQKVVGGNTDIVVVLDPDEK
jgi:bacteriocin-like protein